MSKTYVDQDITNFFLDEFLDSPPPSPDIVRASTS